MKANPLSPFCRPHLQTHPQGLVVGIPEWQAGGKAQAFNVEKRVCDTVKVPVTATLGPLAASQCGTFNVTHTAALRPLAAGAAAITQVAALRVTVTGCPKTAAPAPLITVADPDVEVQEVYTWTARLTSNASNTVSFKQGSAVKVSFTADTQRSPVKRSANVKGTVTLEAPAAAPMVVASATVRGPFVRGKGRAHLHARLICM